MAASNWTEHTTCKSQCFRLTMEQVARPNQPSQSLPTRRTTRRNPACTHEYSTVVSRIDARSVVGRGISDALRKRRPSWHVCSGMRHCAVGHRQRVRLRASSIRRIRSARAQSPRDHFAQRVLAKADASQSGKAALFVCGRVCGRKNQTPLAVCSCKCSIEA